MHIQLHGINTLSRLVFAPDIVVLHASPPKHHPSQSSHRIYNNQGHLLPESKVMTWFVQTALGLHFMHTNRVLHRDIKTQNVFILSSGRVVLGDLGISKVRK